MKKILLGALVGGLIFFLCQAASQMALNLHEPAQQYSASQDSILNYLSTHLKEGGGYMLPRPKNSANLEEVEAFTKSIQGKSWARISYYPTYNMNMGMSMVRSFMTDILVVFLFLLLVNRFKFKTFGSIFISALFVGIIVFANSFYTLHVWYPSYEIRADLIDALASWGLCGLWLGWLIPDKKRY